jgi:phosphatidylinositol glycan class Q protein
MRTHMGLMRIFWPSDTSRSASQGVLIGFQNSESDVFVVGILEQVEVCVHRQDNYEGPH